MKNNNVYHLFRAAIIPSILFLQIILVRGQIPPGYYDPAAGKTGTDLQAALHEIIKDHTVISYSGIMGFFPTTDAKPGDIVWDMYSDVPGGTPPYLYHYNMGQECGNYSAEGDCYNREHSWPQSWFNELLPPKSDMFHIYPTDGWVNGKRSNYPYGTVSSPVWTSLNGCKLGNCSWPGYNGTVFEPLNEYKGDFARSYFYMSTRYYTEDAGWNITDMTDKSQLKPWALQLMLHWSNTDPVSDKEINRNNAVYAIQDNRNPFIDHPEFTTMIWGNPAGVGESSSVSVILHVFPNPAEDQCILQLPAGLQHHDYSLQLVSMDGLTLNPKFSREGSKITVDLSQVSPGAYLLILQAQNGLYRAKMFVN